MGRGMTVREELIKGMAKEIAEEILTSLERATRTCVNCEHFSGDEECKLASPPVRPPAKIIAFGCDGYKEGVPF